MSNVLSIRDQEKSAYLSLVASSHGMEIVEAADGTSAIIGDVELPIIGSVFNLQIVQAGHASRDAKYKKHAGEIYLDGLEEFAERRVLLPMCIVRQGMQLFAGGYDANGSDEANAPICYSLDGIVPSNRVALPMNPVCAEVRVGKGNREYREIVCPKAIWEGDKKAECRGYKVLAFLDITDPEMPIPVKMTLKGTGLSAWSAFNKEYTRTVDVARLKRTNILDYTIVLTTDDKGNYAIPKFTLEYGKESPKDEKPGPSRFVPLLAYYRDKFFSFQPGEDAEQEAATAPAAKVDDAPAIDVTASEVAAGSEVDFDL